MKGQNRNNWEENFVMFFFLFLGLWGGRLREEGKWEEKKEEFFCIWERREKVRSRGRERENERMNGFMEGMVWNEKGKRGRLRKRRRMDASFHSFNFMNE